MPDREIGHGDWHMRDPLEVTVAGDIEQPTIEQLFFEIDLARKPAALAALLLQRRPESSVVFCNTRRDTETVVEALAGFEISALALHDAKTRHPLWRSLALVGRELASGAALDQIPVMRQIAEASVEVFENQM